MTFDTHAEKVLAESTTFAGAIMFTTFSPSGETSSNCGPDTGHAQFYAIDQRTAAPVLDLDNDGDIDENDASTILAHSGIAPHPVIIYGEDGIKTIAIGTETIVDERFEPTTPCDGENCEVEPTMCDENICYVTPVYWRQNDAQE